MTQLTKADIDAIVSRFESCGGDRVLVGPESVDEAWLRRTLYRAAGLQADGSPKPEKVRCWRYIYRDGRVVLSIHEPAPEFNLNAVESLVPGTFTPDGAE